MSKLPFDQGDEQFSLEMQQVADIYQQLSTELFINIVKRLKQRGTADLVREPYIWQLEKLNDMHMLTEANVKLIAEKAAIAESVLRDVIENEGYKVYADTYQQLAEDLVVDRPPNRYVVQEALKSYANQTMFELDNLINTTLPNSVRQAYQAIIQEAVASIVTGLKSPDKALNDTLVKWSDKGFYGFTDKAGRRWRADTYARSVIKSTSYRVYRDMRERPAEELGIDTFYYSMKSSARAMCSPLQHQIVTKGEAREEKGVPILSLQDYGYGTPAGCLGINCGHYMTPFIVGVNDKPELPAHLQGITQQRAEDNARAEAQQRAFEREIRKNKERLKVARAIGDKELIQQYKLKGITLDGQYKTHLDENKFLYRSMKRERLNVVDNDNKKAYNQGMRNSGAVYGAWNDKNDPYYKERDRHAEMYYEQVRNRDKALEIARVARNSGFSRSEIEKIYNHIFINEYELHGGLQRFDPSYDMGESWRRLSELSGKNIQSHDKIMLHHELGEYLLMQDGLSYEDAHAKINQKYNYYEALKLWQRKRGDL